MKLSVLNIISIDPSLSTGVYGINDRLAFNKNIHPVYGDIGFKLNVISCELKTCWVERKKPFDFYIIEKQFKNNLQIMIQGVIMAAMSPIPMIEISPRTWQSIIGAGKLLKGLDKKKDRQAYCFRVKEFFGKEFETTDEADAYMIYHAVCDIIYKPGKLTPAAEKIRLQIEEIMK